LAGGFKGYLPYPAAKAISRQISLHKQMKARRQKVLAEYKEWFGDDLLTQPGEASGHLAVVRLRTPGHRIAATRRLSKLHIDHSLHYPIPDVPCPNAKELVTSLVSLPCNTEMRRHDVLLVARAVLTAV
jgi:dTDP-4-amino-4,6-dideoxygalactose transaminase